MRQSIVRVKVCSGEETMKNTEKKEQALSAQRAGCGGGGGGGGFVYVGVDGVVVVEREQT